MGFSLGTFKYPPISYSLLTCCGRLLQFCSQRGCKLYILMRALFFLWRKTRHNNTCLYKWMNLVLDQVWWDEDWSRLIALRRCQLKKIQKYLVRCIWCEEDASWRSLRHKADPFKNWLVSCFCFGCHVFSVSTWSWYCTVHVPDKIRNSSAAYEQQTFPFMWNFCCFVAFLPPV